MAETSTSMSTSTSPSSDAATAGPSPEMPTAPPPDSGPDGPSNHNALQLAWSFGFNKDLVHGVHNLTTDTRRALFYTSAHTGVIYDYAQRQQRLLQGHCHPISCCVVSEDKRWIITADRGRESMIVVWDADSATPIKTIFQPHALGVQAIDISPDALFLVTLSAVASPSSPSSPSSTEKTASSAQPQSPSSPVVGKKKKKKKERFRQELSVWEWTAADGGTRALHSSFVATEDVQHSVRFNTYDIRELVSNGRQRVIFWNWARQKLLFYSPSLSQRDFRQVVGNFTMSLFVPDSQQALTGTEDGDLVLWDVVHTEEEEDEQDPDDGGGSSSVADRKAVKIVRLVGGSGSGAKAQERVAITHLTDMDGYLVLGSSDGAVRFFDFDFRLVAWFEDMQAGPVHSVSFAATTLTPNAHHLLASTSSKRGLFQGSRRSQPDLSRGAAAAAGGGGHYDRDDGDDFFNVPDFVVGTSSAFIVGMSSSLFAEHDADRRRGTLLMQGINDEIHGLATHPRCSQVVLSSYSGVVQLWDYHAKRLVMMRKFDADKLRPQCLRFSPEGTRVFIGFTSGVIKIVHAHSLEDLTTLRLGKAAITDLRVSADASLFVALDAHRFMGMWRGQPVPLEKVNGDAASPPPQQQQQQFISNEWTYLGRCRAHSQPVTGLEFVQTSDGQPLLVSVGEDKTLVEYCLSRSSIVDGVVLTQSPVPIEQSATPTACCWHPEMKSLQEDMLIIANDEYKLKQWNAHNKTCRKTTLGPCYGGPINRMVPIPVREGTGSVAERYCAYATHDKVVGILKLPLDGNPHKAMGLIAHPGEISNIDVSFDGHYLMTAGGRDLVINLWDVHTNELDVIEASAGNGLEPYLPLLEGGRHGEFYHEIVDYFYFAQLRVQGEQATQAREITARIPLQEIPNVMRALGFYPTEQEIEDMWSEVKYSQFTETTQTVNSITLCEFIKLYVNHRPVFGIGKQDIEMAFQVLGACPNLRWDALQKKLLHRGEAMTEEELRTCLEALVMNDETEALGVVSMDANYTATSFADKVLGFDDYESLEQDGEPVSER